MPTPAISQERPSHLHACAAMPIGDRQRCRLTLTPGRGGCCRCGLAVPRNMAIRLGSGRKGGGGALSRRIVNTHCCTTPTERLKNRDGQAEPCANARRELREPDE
jgi:hypothetical protein